MNKKGGIIMKFYEDPEMEIVRFETEDVITESGDVELPFIPAD